MSVLHKHHILPLYVWVDDALASAGQTAKVIHKRSGRPATLRDSEVATILAFSLFTVQQQTLRQIYDWVQQHHQSDFPKLPAYQNFVAHCHRTLPYSTDCSAICWKVKRSFASWMPPCSQSANLYAVVGIE